MDLGHQTLPSGEVRRTDSSGRTVIPTSRRADGSVRKAVVVKTGYVPQGERTAYSARSRNEGTAHALRSAGLGGGGSLAQRSNGGRIGAPKPVKTLSKNAAKRARKRAAAAKEQPEGGATAVEGAAGGRTAAEAVEATAEAALPPAKQLRKLRKKMKQIAQLEVKRADGIELNAGQEKKLAAKDELAAAIAALEALGIE